MDATAICDELIFYFINNNLFDKWGIDPNSLACQLWFFVDSLHRCLYLRNTFQGIKMNKNVQFLKINILLFFFLHCRDKAENDTEWHQRRLRQQHHQCLVNRLQIKKDFQLSDHSQWFVCNYNFYILQFGKVSKAYHRQGRRNELWARG